MIPHFLNLTWQTGLVPPLYLYKRVQICYTYSATLVSIGFGTHFMHNNHKTFLPMAHWLKCAFSLYKKVCVYPNDLMGLFPVTCTEREEPEFKKLILESVFTQDTAYTVNNQYGY